MHCRSIILLSSKPVEYQRCRGLYRKVLSERASNHSKHHCFGYTLFQDICKNLLPENVPLILCSEIFIVYLQLEKEIAYYRFLRELWEL